jgi:hypothetical protein
MDSIDPDKLEGLFEATEDWSAAMAMSNSMAYVSQFGEYNPGGGEDNVLKYLLEAKKQMPNKEFFYIHDHRQTRKSIRSPTRDRSLANIWK